MQESLARMPLDDIREVIAVLQYARLDGRPLLEHIIGWLRHHGITEIAINLHYRPEAVTDCLGDGGRLPI